MGLHIGAEDSIDAGLVAGMLPKPFEEVGVEAHGHDGFEGGQDHFCVFPEGGSGGVSFGVGGDGLADLGGSAPAEFGLRLFAHLRGRYRMGVFTQCQYPCAMRSCDAES